MVESIDLEKMTNSELAERYFALQAETRQLRERVRQAELAYSSKPSHKALAKLSEARAACSRGPFNDGYRAEIIRRLNAPLKLIRLAKSLSQGEAAKRAGLPRKLIQQIESGKYRANVQVAIRLWKVLDLEIPQEWELLDFS